MKYIVDVLKQLPGSANFNAWSKAPADVIRTLESVGAVPCYIIVPDCKIKIISKLIGFFRTWLISLKLKKGDELYIQRYGYYVDILTFLAKRKKVHLNYIVHDLTFLRFGNESNDNAEINLLKKMDVIFVHTENMIGVLRNHGIEKDFRVMHLFDYYTDDDMIPENEVFAMKNVIAFAGNLDKSAFLSPLVSMTISQGIEYRLYGLKNKLNVDSNKNISYEGAFKPSNTGSVKAGWGLLWDGDSVETCSGAMGEYLKMNSSHKLSLYLVCGMPVIIWNQSSLAGWLSKEGVCLVVESIADIPSRISELSDDDFRRMVAKARCLGKKLRNGCLLKSILS